MAFGISLTTIAYNSLRDLGCLRAAQTAAPDLLNDILYSANQMVDAWQIDPRKHPWRQIDDFALTAGQQYYSIGPNETGTRNWFLNGGAAPGVPTKPLKGVRPIDIDFCNIILTNFSPVIRQPCKVLRDPIDWEKLRVQNIPTAIPLKMYYENSSNPDGAGAFFSFLGLWPGPQFTYQIEFLRSQEIAQFADLTTQYQFPPGFQRCIQKCLAREIAPKARLYAKTRPNGALRDYDPNLLRMVERDARKAEYDLALYLAEWPSLEVDEGFAGARGPRGAFNYGVGDTVR